MSNRGKSAFVPEDVLSELLDLQSRSSRVRGSTPVGHPDRIAGDELAVKAVLTMDAYDITVTRLSLMMGLSEHTMKFFLGRRDAIEVSPGVARATVGTKYRNVQIDRTLPRAKLLTCARGHDTSTPDKRYAAGECKLCRSINTKARRQSTKAVA